MRRRAALGRAAAVPMAIVLVASLVLWPSAASAAQARPSAGTPGPRAAAPSPLGLASALGQATGLSPGQVATQDVCPPASVGYARCAAQALVLRANGSLVRPHFGAQPSLGRVKPKPSRGSPSPAAAPASTPPQPDTPAYLQEAYDLAYLSQTAGSGDTVAIVDAYDDPSAASDLATYRSAFGLPACTTSNGCFKEVNQAGASSPLPARNSAWEKEISLDLDAVSAVCPNCHILLVETTTNSASDLDAGVREAASMGASQISASWTLRSSSVVSGAYTFPGIATVAATGDSGYVGPSSDNYPAALPGVTAAGGTTLAPATSSSVARGFGESAWSLSDGNGGGSGCDLRVAKPSYQTDSGCTGRAYADVSADANPSTGLVVLDSGNGGLMLVGGTSLATPLVAAYDAITGVAATSPQWAYQDSGLLNDIVSGSNGTCAAAISYICNAGVGYDGPTGVGSISGAVSAGAPGIGGPPISTGSSLTYTEGTRSRGATLEGGIYPNGLDTTWWIQYGTTTAYGSQTPASDIGSGRAPAPVTGYPSQLASSTTYHYRLVAQNDRGTTYGYDYTFTTPAATPTDPSASFATSPQAPGPAVSTTFDATGSSDSGAAITDYRWDFGDGTTEDAGSTPTVSHTYSSRGNYTATLLVTNNLGQSNSSTRRVTVDNPPAATFTPSTTVTTPGSPVNLDATASTAGPGGTIADYSWNFGDGTSQDAGAAAASTHTYAHPGVYTITLTVADDLGATSTASHQITIDLPTPTFTSSTTGAAPGTSFTFDATGSTDPEGTITDYRWNFGDGTTSDTGTTATTSHTYSGRGSYTVTLTITNSFGQTGASSQQVTVDHPPTAAFTPSTTVTTPGSPVNLDATASTAGAGGTIADYSWNFGDGTSQDAHTTATTAHTYAHPGLYMITLTVTDDLGVTSTASRQITTDLPAANFTSSPTLPAPGTSMTLDGTGSTDPEGTITDYRWNFGDGTTSDAGTTATTSHTYSGRGSYTVTLTVTNNLNQTNVTSQQVTVDDPPTAAFTPSATLTTMGSPVILNATASAPGLGGTIADYRWNFGDGTTQDAGTVATATHTFAHPGTYTVALTVTDDLGIKSTTSDRITVDHLTAGFTTSPTPAAAGAAVTFDATGSTDPEGTITDYHWNFGDGTTSDAGSTPTTTHAYLHPGLYTIMLTVTDNLGVTSTANHQITIDHPTAAFTASPNPARIETAVGFTGGGSGDPGGTITHYAWSFGDGSTATGPSPAHAYATVGTYQVTLTVTGSGGLTDTTSRSILVIPPPPSAQLTAEKRQRIKSVLRHGLVVSLSIAQASRASFQVTIPKRTAARDRRGALGHMPATITLLQTRAQPLASGSHRITLKLSRAAASRLSRGSIAVTIRLTLTDSYGAKLSRSVVVILGN